MSTEYSTIATIAQSPSLRVRIHAAIAKQYVYATPPKTDAKTDAEVQRDLPNLMWFFAAQGGWVAKWETAVTNQIADPGNDPGVITDGDILSAVGAVMGI